MVSGPILQQRGARGSHEAAGDGGALDCGKSGGSVMLRWPGWRFPARKNNSESWSQWRRVQKGRKTGRRDVSPATPWRGREERQLELLLVTKCGRRKRGALFIEEELGWGSRAPCARGDGRGGAALQAVRAEQRNCPVGLARLNSDPYEFLNTF
jgi:hypothetical protein